MPIYSWSQTASSNATADSTINWAEGQAPSTVNDSARAMMAAVAKWRDDHQTTITTSGTSTAYTVSSNSVYDSLAHMAGARLSLKIHATSGAAPTLNVDSLGAKNIVFVSGTNVQAGDLQINCIYDFVYDNVNTVWTLVSPSANTLFPSGTLMLFQQTAAPTGWTKQTTHNDKALRVVSGTASSGGSTAFSTVFSALTLARNQLPNVDFMTDGAGNVPTASSGTLGVGSVATGALAAGGSSIPFTASGISISVGGHIYLNGNTTQQTVNLAVQYVDLIIAAKN